MVWQVHSDDKEALNAGMVSHREDIAAGKPHPARRYCLRFRTGGGSRPPYVWATVNTMFDPKVRAAAAGASSLRFAGRPRQPAAQSRFSKLCRLLGAFMDSAQSRQPS